MKNQPNKATVKDGLPTAEQIINKKQGNLEYPNYYHESRVIDAMEEHTQLHTQALRERVKELEAQNKRLKIAHYAIVRAYEEYGPLAAVSTKQVSENVLKETEFDPSKETL